MSVIQDGTGQGYQAQVDNHGRLYVNANHVSHEQHHTTYHQNLFTLQASVTLSDSNEAPLLHMDNTGAIYDYELFQCIVTSTANVTIKTYEGAEYSSGGVLLTSRNMNVGKGTSSTITAYEGGASDDLALTTTEQKFHNKFYVGGYRPFMHDYRGGCVVPPSTKFHWTAQGSASDVVELAVVYTRHTQGTKL